MTLQYRQNVDFQVAQSPNDIIDSQLIIQDYAVHPRKPAQEGSQGHEQMRAAAASASPGRSRAQTLAHLAGSQPVGIPAAHQQPPRPSAYGDAGVGTSAGHFDLSHQQLSSQGIPVELPHNVEDLAHYHQPRRHSSRHSESPPEASPQMAKQYSRSAESYSPLGAQVLGGVPLHAKSAHNLLHPAAHSLAAAPPYYPPHPHPHPHELRRHHPSAAQPARELQPYLAQPYLAQAHPHHYHQQQLHQQQLQQLQQQQQPQQQQQQQLLIAQAQAQARAYRRAHRRGAGAGSGGGGSGSARSSSGRHSSSASGGGSLRHRQLSNESGGGGGGGGGDFSRKSSHGPGSVEDKMGVPATPPFTYTVRKSLHHRSPSGGQASDGMSMSPGGLISVSPPFLSAPSHLLGQAGPPPLNLDGTVLTAKPQSHQSDDEFLIFLPASPFQILEDPSAPGAPAAAAPYPPLGATAPLCRRGGFASSGLLGGGSSGSLPGHGYYGYGAPPLRSSASVDDTQDQQGPDTQSQDLPFSLCHSGDDLKMATEQGIPLPLKNGGLLGSSSVQHLLNICDSFEMDESIEEDAVIPDSILYEAEALVPMLEEEG